MTAPHDKHDNEQLAQIIASARALGVEIDEERAIQWLTAVAASKHSTTGSFARPDIKHDKQAGIFGHRVALLDFDPSDLDRIRRVAAIVELEDSKFVETAIALSGSSAQSHVQVFPGDFDFLERVNIKALTLEAAQDILSAILRDKALKFAQGPGYQLTEVRFGSFKRPVVREGKQLTSGSSITWSAAEIEDGEFDVLTTKGKPLTIKWDDAARDPGWCKLDWVLVDPAQPRAIKASNMLDVTWEAPDGTLKPLDGFIDPYYQEVYLNAESIPLFCKVIDGMDPNAQRKYIEELEAEIAKLTSKAKANYGKAAKRLYNVFRLTGRFEEAAFVRELFDDPAALLYQVGAILDGLADIGSQSSAISRETLAEQISGLIRDVIKVAEGEGESELVMQLIRLRDHVTGYKNLTGGEWEDVLRQMQTRIDGLVNEFYEVQLCALPQVKEYLDNLRA